MLTLIIALALQTLSVHAGGKSWGFRTGDLPASAWWVYDIPTGAYAYVGPGCWDDVLASPVPTNCRVIKWRDRDVGGDARTVGYISCDLAFYYGHDPNGEGCIRGTPISDPDCTLDGDTRVSPGFMTDTELKTCLR